MTTWSRPRRPPHRRLLVPAGVYRPDDDTALLTRALEREAVGPDTTALDLGTGSGTLALAAAGRGARVTAVDISWRAVWTTRLNALWHGADVTVRHGDLDSVPGSGSFDLALSNPPYVPTPRRLPQRAAARAWDGGPSGRAVVDRVCAAAARVLRPGGALLMVHSTLCGEHESVTCLEGLGMKAVVAGRAFVPFGPVVRARRSWLRAEGFLDDAANMEELVVIRAERI
ncbi:methyltransferase [Streptomyces arenae]|nr:methyltransferase [Streptomyces arenae]